MNHHRWRKELHHIMSEENDHSEDRNVLSTLQHHLWGRLMLRGYIDGVVLHRYAMNHSERKESAETF